VLVQSRGDLPIATAPSLWLTTRFPQTLGFGSGLSVSSWVDKSANGFDGSQITAAKQPTYTLDAINGRPALYFDGGDHLALDNSQLHSNKAGKGLTVFAVIKTDVGGSGYFFGKFNTDQQEFFCYANTGGNNSQFCICEALNSATTADWATTIEWENASIFTGWWQPNENHRIYYNGLLKSTNEDVPVQSISSGTEHLRVGAISGGLGNQLEGYIGEIIAFPAGLSDADLYAMVQYLMYEWRIA